MKLAEGRHELAVAAADERGNRAAVVVAFYVENQPTVLELSFEPNRVDQGRILVAKLNANKKLYDLEGELWEQKFPFYKTADGFASIVGIRASCPPGAYPVTVRGYDAYDKPLELKGTVTVADGGYVEEEVVIASAEKKQLFDPALEEKKMLEYRKVQSIITRKRDEQLWAGTFAVPAKGRVTSPFGTYRTFNTGGEERHLGVDIANKEGTPVRTANRGEVMLAEELIVRGKAVIVDHGRGVFSIYNHLSAAAVSPGEKVEKGQIIGYMGSSGLATGSHLHWEMRVFKWVVDPGEWTKKAFTYRSPEEEAEALREVESGYEAALTAAPPKAKDTAGGHLEPGELIPDTEGAD
jgi:murein DD-endopeptidase MepM/ murein hydrolase activator NlpD